MAYTDANTVSNPTTGQPILAAWGDQIRTNQEFFIDPPGCSVYNSSAQSLANNTGTVLTANSENFDNDSMHSTSVNTSRITIQTAGRYLVIAAVSFSANSTGNRQVNFKKNGSGVAGGSLLDNSGASNSTAIVQVQSLVLAASDYVEVEATQRSGGNLNTTLSEFAAFFMTR